MPRTFHCDAGAALSATVDRARVSIPSESGAVRAWLRWVCTLPVFWCVVWEAHAGGGGLIVQPERIRLGGSDRQHGILVSWVGADGMRSDRTDKAIYVSSDPGVVSVDEKGQCRAVAGGEAEIRVTHEGETVRVSALVERGAGPVVPSFRQDIVPLLTRSGCNAGGCHGKLSGQNGFRLSLRGFAPDWDFDWITRDVGGRRVNFAFPEQSLLVRKATGGVPHEGGTRFRADSRSADLLIDWIAARAPDDVASAPASAEANPDRLEVLPGDRRMKIGETQRLLVLAHYPGGRVRDVTWLAQFFSNDESTVTVRSDGRVTARNSGETSVRVHFQSLVEVVAVSVPYAEPLATHDYRTVNNPIDGPVFSKLKDLGLPPSPPCDDATFLRRAFLDTIGMLPTPEEVEAFLSDARADKRRVWIDDLLSRPEWVDLWALQLADFLQNRRERDHDVRGVKGVRSFHAWLRGELTARRGWDAIAREVLLARGDVLTQPQVGYFVTVLGEYGKAEESEVPDSVAQAFLGTRIGCARCHNHPLERYTQDDFYHFAAFFSSVRLKREKPEYGATELTRVSREEEEQRRRLEELDGKLSVAGEFAVAIGAEPGSEAASKALEELRRQMAEVRATLERIAAREPAVTQPRTGKSLSPQPLDRTPWPAGEKRDPREVLATWMLGSPNFSGAMVNRVWKHFMGVGLVEPVDDLRASNPPTNRELWAVLNREFVDHGFDLTHLMRLILNSRVYQLDSGTRDGNAQDARFYSHYYARRLPAEVLLDAVSSATGSPVVFAGYPVGLRAVQLPEPGVGSYFLTLFGRSDRVTACACERSGEVTLPQLLHVRNSADLLAQIGAPQGRLQALLGSGDDDALVRSLFLASLNRPPTPTERASVGSLLGTDPRDAVYRDLFWALLNSKEFAFNH